MIKLYGMNRAHLQRGQPVYWTNIEEWCIERKRITGREPMFVNTTSASTDPDFVNLSPMRMGPVHCYQEGKRTVTAVSLEVAWQYSKVYSHVINGAGKLVDLGGKFLTKDSRGNLAPSKAWFQWRDAAFRNPCFTHTHPAFKSNKKLVRRAYAQGSQIAFWYWDGEILNRLEARQKIYARLYRQFAIKTPGFKRLRKIVRRGEDLKLFDKDGYDWVDLGMTPEDCVNDTHSFGHGLVIALLLQKIDPTRLVIKGKTCA